MGALLLPIFDVEGAIEIRDLAFSLHDDLVFTHTGIILQCPPFHQSSNTQNQNVTLGGRLGCRFHNWNLEVKVLV